MIPHSQYCLQSFGNKIAINNNADLDGAFDVGSPYVFLSSLEIR